MTSCSPTYIVENTTCDTCTQSPSYFWCVADRTCYCNSSHNRRLCTQLLRWPDGGNELFVKPCVVSPSVSPEVDCPPSYKDYCSSASKICKSGTSCSPTQLVCPPSYYQPNAKCTPTYKICLDSKDNCAPSTKICSPSTIQKQCQIPLPSSTSPTKQQIYDKYISDLEEYRNNLKREPPPFKNEDDVDWISTYRDSQYCYDCNQCDKGPYVPPKECVYGKCIMNDNGKQILRCTSPDNRDDICDIHSSKYCLGKNRTWIKTNNPDDCFQYPIISSPEEGSSCQGELPFKFSKIGPALNPAGMGMHQPYGKGPIRCKPKGAFTKTTLLFIILASIFGGLSIILFTLYYFF